MRVCGLIAAVLVALLVLPMAAHSDDKFPFDPKKGGLEAEGPGKGKKKIPVEILIHLKFFTPRGSRGNLLKWKTPEKGRWIKQTKWWVDRINDNCEIRKIDGVKYEGRDRDKIPRKMTNYAENEGVLTSSDPNKDKFFIGDANLVDVIGTNTSTRFFNIGIFRTVRVEPQFVGSSGIPPGKYIAPNVMAAKVNMKRCDRRHELGHLMGLTHKDHGLMHKNKPRKGASRKSSPWYGDEHGGCNDFLKSWCPKIAAHLGL